MSIYSWRIHHFKETVSTNLEAKKGKPGDVFTADFQTAGRGRLDHSWLSPPGENLMMSVVVDVSGLAPQSASTLPLVAGLAVVEALESEAPGLALKWPNDIMSNGRKLAGILCERYDNSVIIGIGVNVRQTVFPDALSGRATSLALLGSLANRDFVRDAILDSLASLLPTWHREGFAALWPRIASRDLLKGRSVAIRDGDGARSPIIGLSGGISPNGSLLVNGRAVWSGEAHVEDF